MDSQEFWEDYQHLKKEATKLRTSEARLKEIRARYRTLFENTPGIVAIISNEGVILEMNPAGVSLLGMKSDELVGKSINDAFPDDRAREFGRKAGEAITSNQTVTFDWTVPRLNGPALWLAGRAAPVMDETQTVVAAVVTAKDLTDWLALDEDLASIQDQVSDLRRLIRDRLDREQS